eukprot:UN15198
MWRFNSINCTLYITSMSICKFAPNVTNSVLSGFNNNTKPMTPNKVELSTVATTPCSTHTPSLDSPTLKSVEVIKSFEQELSVSDDEESESPGNHFHNNNNKKRLHNQP